MYQLLRFAALLLGLALTSCQVLADIETHDPDPLPKDCVLPEAVSGDGNGRARLAHVFPTFEKIDVCHRQSGTPAYGRPVLRSSGLDVNNICGAGLQYTQVTVPFKVPTGKLDFKIVAAGKTCSSPALAETTGVQVGTDVVLTLAYMGPPEGPGTLAAMFESKPSSVLQNRSTRLVNAIAGSMLDWGVAAESKLPTTLERRFLNTPLGFAQLPTKGMEDNSFFNIDEFGYLTFIASSLPTGAAVRGSNKMLFLHYVEGAGNLTYYAIGAPNSAFPERGLVCRDIEKDDQRQRCTVTDLEAFRIDVFNAGLYGAFAAAEALRAPQVISDLAARGATSDLLCVSEVSRHDDLNIPESQKGWTQDALIRAANSVENGFRYFAQAKTDLDTPVDDPVDQAGNMPTPPGRAPCDAAADQTAVDRVYSCLIDKCNTTPGMDTGVTAGGTNCYSASCGGNALAFLLFGDENQRQCFNCVVLNGLSYLPWSENKKRCATDTRFPLGFNGKTTSMLLSKVPLTDVEQFVIPTSAFRRTGVYARMTYEGEKSIDVYCIHAPPLLGSNIPYTGPYGNMASPTSGSAWQEEQMWGVQKIIAWIQRKSAGRPAIIMGDWSSSAKVLDKMGNPVLGPDGLPAVADVTPDTHRLLQAAFSEAIPDVFKPQCTRCPAGGTGELHNPYNAGVIEPMWNVRVYIKDPWGATNPTQSAELFYHELDRVQFPPGSTEFGIAGPLADTFGFRVNIRRP